MVCDVLQHPLDCCHSLSARHQGIPLGITILKHTMQELNLPTRQLSQAVSATWAGTFSLCMFQYGNTVYSIALGLRRYSGYTIPSLPYKSTITTKAFP
jgi:hypothetical protein